MRSYTYCCRFLRGSTPFTSLQALKRSTSALLVEAIAGAKRLHPLLPVKHVQLLDGPAVQHFHQLVHLRNATRFPSMLHLLLLVGPYLWLLHEDCS